MSIAQRSGDLPQKRIGLCLKKRSEKRFKTGKRKEISAGPPALEIEGGNRGHGEKNNQHQQEDLNQWPLWRMADQVSNKKNAEGKLCYLPRGKKNGGVPNRKVGGSRMFGQRS